MCHIFRFFISLKIDSGKPLGKRMKKHLAKCADCRSYLEIHLKLTNEEIADYSIEKKRALEQRIISGLNSVSIKSHGFKSRIKPAVVFASLTIIAVLFTGILLIKSPQKRSVPKYGNELQGIIDITGSKTVKIDNIFSFVEEPFIKEVKTLNESYISLKDYFRSALDLKLNIN